MKTFREQVIEEKADKGYTEYKKNFNVAINSMNAIVDYGRKIEVDNAALNPILEAIKNLHAGDDIIQNALFPKEEEEAPKDKPKNW